MEGFKILRPIKSMTFTRSGSGSGSDISSNATGKQKPTLCGIKECVENIKCRASLRKKKLTYSEVLASKFSRLDLTNLETTTHYADDEYETTESSSSEENVHSDDHSIAETEQEIELLQPQIPAVDLWNWHKPKISNIPFLPLPSTSSTSFETNSLMPFQPVPNIDKNEMRSLRQLTALQPSCVWLSKNCTLCRETQNLHENILSARKIRTQQEQHYKKVENKEFPMQMLPLLADCPDVKKHSADIATDFERKFYSIDTPKVEKSTEWNIPHGFETDIKKIINQNLDKQYVPQISPDLVYPPYYTNITIFAIRNPHNQIIDPIWNNQGIYTLCTVDFSKDSNKDDTF